MKIICLQILSLHTVMFEDASFIDELEELLKKLTCCLETLSSNILYSNQIYNFDCFALNSKLVEDIDEEGALNYALKVTFASMSRVKGINLVKQSSKLTTMTNVLRKYN